MKEYSNRGTEAQDESLVRMEKKSSMNKGERYNFSTTAGINYGGGGKFGAKVMALGMAGGSFGISGHLDKSKSETEETQQSNTEEFSFSYHQEEKIKVPAGKRAKAKITTYSMKYESQYTLKFSTSRDTTIPLWYKTKCQQMCLRICKRSSYGEVQVREMMSTLPNYNAEDENDTVSYMQTGILSWFGEGCTVEKVEESL